MGFALNVLNNDWIAAVQNSWVKSEEHISQTRAADSAD